MDEEEEKEEEDDVKMRRKRMLKGFVINDFTKTSIWLQRNRRRRKGNRM